LHFFVAHVSTLLTILKAITGIGKAPEAIQKSKKPGGFTYETQECRTSRPHFPLLACRLQKGFLSFFGFRFRFHFFH
jgi:hypothetical protein